jgi:hypothetical protein
VLKILTLPTSPTEQRPLSARVFQEPQFRRQQMPKAEPLLHNSALPSGVHDASHSVTQARQDSAIDQHRFDMANDAQLSKSNGSHSHQSPKDSQRQPSPRLNFNRSTPSTPAFAPVIALHQADTPPSQAGAHCPVRQHSKSLSSGVPTPTATSSSHEHGADRTSPVDIKNGADIRGNSFEPSSLPEQLYGHHNSSSNRQQRYNVRFAANYTSENMPPSQKARNDLPSPTAAPVIAAGPEQQRSSPAPVATTEETPAPIVDGAIHYAETQPRTPRDTRDRGDREPSVERCVGCNEAWRRPIPDLDSRHISPAETNEEFRQIASNMIERLRDQRKKADAAYDEWRWHHSHCTRSDESHYQPTSPSTTEPVDDAPKRANAVARPEEPMTRGTLSNKRKSEALHDSSPQSLSKQRKVAFDTSAPPVRKPDSS